MKLTDYDKYVEVTGERSHVMLFWSVWQTALWPGWISAANEWPEQLQTEFCDIIQTIRDKHLVCLHDRGEPYVEALKTAVALFRKLEIPMEYENHESTGRWWTE